MVEVIQLGATPSNDNIIRLGKPKKKFFRKRTIADIETIPIALKKIGLASPKLTVGLAGVLTGLLTRSPLAVAKVVGVTALGLGALQVSPILRKKVGEKIKDPLAAGRFVGEKIEEIAKPPLENDKTLKEKIIEGAKKAGLIGAGVALAGAGLAVVKKVKEAKIPKLPSLIPSVVSPAATLEGVPVQTLIQPEPISAIPKEIPKEKVVELVEKPAPPSIKNVFKPSIDIRFSKRRQFINQQILIKK